MSVSLRNNYHPLHFHSVHGDNIRLSKYRTVACRSKGFCNGIVFSDRPVMICEPVYVKFLKTSPNWCGALRIGFTMNDPLTLKSKLPCNAYEDLTSMHGIWAKAVGEKLAKKDSVLYYYVDHNGDVHYGIGSEEYGIFFRGVNTSGKLWAVLDIYGTTVAVEFMESKDNKCVNPCIDLSEESDNESSNSQNIASKCKKTTEKMETSVPSSKYVKSRKKNQETNEDCDDFPCGLPKKRQIKDVMINEEKVCDSKAKMKVLKTGLKKSPDIKSKLNSCLVKKRRQDDSSSSLKFSKEDKYPDNRQKLFSEQSCSQSETIFDAGASNMNSDDQGKVLKDFEDTWSCHKPGCNCESASLADTIDTVVDYTFAYLCKLSQEHKKSSSR